MPIANDYCKEDQFLVFTSRPSESFILCETPEKLIKHLAGKDSAPDEYKLVADNIGGMLLGIPRFINLYTVIRVRNFKLF